MAIISFGAAMTLGGFVWIFSASATGSLSALSAQSLHSGATAQQRGDRPMSATPSPTRTPRPTPMPSSTPTPTPPPVAAPAPVVEAAPEPAPEPAPGPVSPLAATADEAAMAREVVVLANQKRAEVGCGPVADDPAFAAVSQAHARDMSERGYFDHTTPEGITPWDRAGAAGINASGENIAAVSPSAQGVIDAWMGSPGHRDNMLNCGQTKLGVGVYLTGPHKPYWVQLFG